MYSSSNREAAKSICPAFCSAPLLHCIHEPFTPKSSPLASASAYEFTMATISTLYPNIEFTNHESLPSLQVALTNFNDAYPQYSQTDEADEIRDKEYYHLNDSNQVCLDYNGHGLFSYSQVMRPYPNDHQVPSTSSSSPPQLFDISCNSVSFNHPMLFGNQGTEFESKIRSRIMKLMNISESDYSMVFTAHESSAFKLVADSYPFKTHRNLLTVYDYKNEVVETMIDASSKRGAKVMSAEFSWPNLSVQSEKLKSLVTRKRKKKMKRGLFVFPLQSRATGARYSYQWMTMAQENGWHILLDASALGPKDMDSLGLSFFRPDFLICSFYRVFGENPSGFCCLFIKKSSLSVLTESSVSSSIAIASLSQPIATNIGISSSNLAESSPSSDSLFEQVRLKQDTMSIEIEELDEPIDAVNSTNIRTSLNASCEIEFRGLDHADQIGLIRISIRTRCLINWLVNAVLSLQHPNSDDKLPVIRIYGPKIQFDRAPALAFNLFDWKGEKVNPSLVQKLADRNNISLSCSYLQHIVFSDKSEEDKERHQGRGTTGGVKLTDGSKKRNKGHSDISVVTAALGFLSNFEDVYRLWTFLARFLDADFVEKERWRFCGLNQEAIEIQERRKRLGVVAKRRTQSNTKQKEERKIEWDKQDNVLFDLSNKLDGLKNMAVYMRSETDSQNKAIGHLEEDMDMKFHVKGGYQQARCLLGK